MTLRDFAYKANVNIKKLNENATIPTRGSE